MDTKALIKKRRLALGLTMKQVADACEVSEATVSRWESGDINNMKRSRIAALAKVLQIPGSVLIAEDTDELAEDIRILFDKTKDLNRKELQEILHIIDEIKNSKNN